MSCPNCSIEKPPSTPNTVFPCFFAQFSSIAMLLNRLEGLKMNSAEVDTLWYIMVYLSYGKSKMYACEHNFAGAWPRLLLDAFQMYGGGSTYGSSLLTDECWIWITTSNWAKVHVHFGVPLIQTSFHMSWFKTFWDAWRRAICMRKTNMKRSHNICPGCDHLYTYCWRCQEAGRLLAFRFWMYSISIKISEVFQRKICSVGASDANLMEHRMFLPDALFINQSNIIPFIKMEEFEILLMEEILHQLIYVVYPTIYQVLYIPGGAGLLPSTVWLKYFEMWLSLTICNFNCSALVGQCWT